MVLQLSRGIADIAIRSGTAENPILDRYEESKDEDNLISLDDQERKPRGEAGMLDYDEDEDVVNEIDTFLIEDEDL